MNRTKHTFTVVERIEGHNFQAITDVVIEYIPYRENHGVIDDKVARINERICQGTLLKDPEIMVFDSEIIKDDLHELVNMYFGIDTCSIFFHTDHQKVVSTDYIRELFRNNNKKGDVK